MKMRYAFWNPKNPKGVFLQRQPPRVHGIIKCETGHRRYGRTALLPGTGAAFIILRFLFVDKGRWRLCRRRMWIMSDKKLTEFLIIGIMLEDEFRRPEAVISPQESVRAVIPKKQEEEGKHVYNSHRR